MRRGVPSERRWTVYAENDPMKLNHLRNHMIGIACFGVALAITSQSFAESSCKDPELITPGKLTIAYNGDMPGTGTQDGKLVGIDGEIMSRVAEKLGLTVEPKLMEWAAEIESVKARRVDVMHGMMGWNEPRSKVIRISDPIYYAGPLLTQKKGRGITKLEQLKALRVATVQGFGWVTELQTINPDLKLYDTSDAMIRDLAAGRVDVVLADPPLIQYIATKQPDLNIESIPVTDPYDPKLPTITGKYQVVVGLFKDAPHLEACVNEAIADMWKSCQNLKIAASYGFSDKYWFSPPNANPRAGIDRAKDWAYPQLGSCP